MRKLFIVCFILFSALHFAQPKSPKYEFRGVWIAALGIDWPNTQGTSASDIQNQKTQLVNIFNAHKNYGLNAIFFHVRPICDALYKSSFEPWSNFVTGEQGTPPSDPNYDPLKFAVEEAHKRGMELHAWLNPYRAELPGGSAVSANHVINKHPEWIIKCNGSQYRFLNPGLPEVRNYVVKIVMDIVNRYDVDGIHFDDYFYPYSEYGTYNDDAAFSAYPNGFTNKADWRKNNVNLLLEMIYDSIKTVKPWVKFGVSPSGNPSVNTTIYCDPAAWLAGTYTDSTGTQHTGESYIDYILPQLYWGRYNNLLSTWSGSSFLNDRHLYIGQAAYRYGTSEMPADEAGWEVITNRSNVNVKGGVYFSSRSLTNNLGYGSDTLKYNYFTHPAIVPKMNWIDGSDTKPNAPLNVRFEVNSTSGKYELHWDKPSPAPDGDTAFAYVIYRSENSVPDISDSTNLFGITGDTFLPVNESRYSVTKGNYYAVTAVDRYSNESDISNIVSLDLASLIPGEPQLLSPLNDSHDVGLSISLAWTGDANSERYMVQVSEDSNFSTTSNLMVWEYRNSQIPFRNIIPGDHYFWRVKAYGQVGESEFSDVFKFQSGIPLAPVLLTPAHATLDVSLTPEFTWLSTEKAESYQFQLSTTVQFYSNTIFIDETIQDTSFDVTSPLTTNKKYYWRVAAKNSYGTSFWSDDFGFKTTSTTDINDEKIPTELSLKQNYPNPFNPSTEINFSIDKPGFVTLKIYNMLGKEVAQLVNKELIAGYYSLMFNADGLASGTYIYQLSVNNARISKKMILLK